ncbi:HAMP domain-containing sensor histidine kinase [Uliginosibacterium flavum]|uniref:histidine kinase n=2 Tax=Uliginosibacterium flavum TaxID=1396831 RepID=A0ABV2TGL7_9RHOO
MSPHRPTSSASPQGFFRLLPRTVRGAAILALVLGLAIPSLLAYFIEQRLSVQAARHEIRLDLRNAVETLALSMRPLLWELSRENAEAVAQATLNDERYVSITITSGLDAQPFVKLERPANAENAAAELASDERDVLHEGKVIGKLVVTMSTAPYLAASQRALRWNTLRVAVMLICSIGLILLVLQRRLFAPLQQLTQATNRIANKQFATPIQLPLDDEFGDAGAAMEQMRLALLETFDALGEKNRELADHAGHLEQRVTERTLALSHANVELQGALQQLQTAQDSLVESEKLASLGRLVAGVAHELNTPIGNAMTVASTLEEHYRSLLTAMEAGTLKRSTMQELLNSTRDGQQLVYRNLARAAEIIQHFKQLAIDQTSEMRRKFDLAEMLEEVLITLRPHFRHSHLQLEIDVAPGILMDGFPGPLGQVVTNLALNAAFHAFPHPEANHRVHLKVSLTGPQQVLLCVMDNGIGMTEDVRKHAFDPFFTTKLGQGGSGLGLHIVRNIVTGLLGGQIELLTEDGKGCEFRITLPLCAPGQEVVAP